MSEKLSHNDLAAATATLVRLVHDTSWNDIPVNMRHEIKRSLINYFAVALAGSTDPTTEIVVRTFSGFSAGNTARLIGRRECFDILHAAAVNALCANVHDYDDTHIPTIIHPTAPVAAPLLAHGDAVGQSSLGAVPALSGKDFMLAFLLGVEVQCRIGMAISPYHYAHGWHITSTCGVFGAAMAVGKVMAMEPERLRWALGAAACQAGGLVEGLGTMAKSISVGNAARNGMVSALLAREGFDGPPLPLEGTYGFVHVFGDKPDLQVISRGLGGEWHLSKVAYKPYPCGVVLNPVIDASLELAGQLAPHELDDITRIEITGHPLLRQRTDRPDISSGRESQVSAQHAVPVALLRRDAGLSAFSDAAAGDPAIRALGKKVRFIDDERYSVESAKVTLRFDRGRILEKYVPVARGALARPLQDHELESKLRKSCDFVRAGIDCDSLIDAIWNLESLDDVSILTRIATGNAESLG